MYCQLLRLSQLSFEARAIDLKIDKTTALVKATHGSSLDVNAEATCRFRGAFRIDRLPAGVVAAWKPEGRPAAVLRRWFATHWCNYRCPYFRQNHARRQQIDGHWAHCFDNWPVDRWLRAFQSVLTRRTPKGIQYWDPATPAKP